MKGGYSETEMGSKKRWGMKKNVYRVFDKRRSVLHDGKGRVGGNENR